MTRCTALDVAEHAGVSVSTVSVVLNERADAVGIAEKTRRRVLASAKKLGYRPNRIAHALSTGTSYMLELWTYGVYPPYYGQVAHNLMRILKGTKYDMRVVQTGMGRLSQSGQESLSKWPVDGIFAFDTPGQVAAFLEPEGGSGTPIVNVGICCDRRLDYVEVDLYPAAVEAVQHLCNRGRKRVAYIVAEPEDSADPRYRAYLDVLRDKEMRPEVLFVPVSDYSKVREATMSYVKQYVTSEDYPDAMFCCSDEYAIGAFRALRDLGLRVPDDVALVGCDGIEETLYHDPRISTIVYPIEEICSLAWEYLQRRMDDPEIPLQQSALKPRLEIRESSG